MRAAAIAVAAGACLSLPAAAGAQPQPPQPPQPGAPNPLPRLSAGGGYGLFHTDTSSGRESVNAVSLQADWRPLADPLLGLRVQYGYGAIDDGTSLAHSKRRSHLVSALATRHWRATGSLYLFGGLGLGSALVHTSHEVGDDSHTGVALKPGWAYAAGLDVVLTRVTIRLDGSGLWHQVSRDETFAVRLGFQF